MNCSHTCYLTTPVVSQFLILSHNFPTVIISESRLVQDMWCFWKTQQRSFMLVLTITGTHKISQCFSQVMKWGEEVGIKVRYWECHNMHICNFTYAHKIVWPSLPQFSQNPQIINSIMFRRYMQIFIYTGK